MPILMISFVFCSLVNPLFSQKIIEVSSLKILNDSADVTTVLNSYLNLTDSNAVFLIPKGIYHLYPDKAPAKYCYISNHDDGLYNIGFDLSNKKNITIDGQGSEFIFHGDMIPFNVENSSEIKLKNFSFDWHRTFHSQGEVVAVDTLKNTFDMHVDEAYPYRMEKDRLIWIADKNQSEWDKTAWMQDVQVNLFFDKKTKATVYDVKEYKLNPYYPLLHTQMSMTEIEPGLIRVYDTIAKLPEVGWIWVSKGGLRPDRTAPGIRLFGSKEILLDNINVYHAGGMGIIAERSENISLKNVKVMLPPDKPERIVSSTADATHFVNCKGTITMDSCFFENMLDDATNIHGSYLKVIKRIDAKTIGVRAPHEEQSVYRWATAGDTIAFSDNQTMELMAKHVVKSYLQINTYYAEIEFESDLNSIKVNYGIENIKWNPVFYMRNCTVQNNRARSILLSSNKKMVIENNRFLNPMMAAISIAGDMNYWFESGNVNELIIRNNYFENACTGGFNQAVITVEPIVPNPEKATTLYHKNISIDNNTFNTFDTPILDCFFTENISFTNNTITSTKSYKPLQSEKPAIDIKNCKNITIIKNNFAEKGKYQLRIDQKSSSIKVKANKGLME
ncbi:MAG: right-handed parallel beta-helix repeat-containing protein [Prolixibacteraceae bacterium]